MNLTALRQPRLPRSGGRSAGHSPGAGDPRSAGRPAAEPWLATLFRMAAYAMAVAVFAWPLTTPSAVLAAATGASLGALGGPRLARSRLRLVLLAVLSAAGIGAALAGRWLVVGTGAFSLDPAVALRLGDAVVFGGGSFFAVLGLRAATTRYRALGIVELAFVAVAFAQLVVAHRHGAINRPFPIADPIIAQGGDPSIAFLVLGGVGAAVLLLLLLGERSVLRSVLHVTFVLVLLGLVVFVAERVGPPAPPAGSAGLGLRPDGEGERKDEDGEGRPSGGSPNNEQLEFRDDYNEQGRQAPVAVTLFHDDYSPPSGVYYFRQGAFSQYNGRRLVRATRPGVDTDLASGFPASPTKVAEPDAVGQSRAPVEQTIALLAEHTRPFGLEAPVRFEPAPNPNQGRFKRTYRVMSQALTSDYVSLLGAAPGSGAWDDATWTHYTDGPDDPRYEELARTIIEEKLPEPLRGDQAAQVMAISRWLGEKGTYSLKSSHASSDDPTAHFLFGDLTGYCVHFAHAAAYLMRSVGLPTRVATGYAIDESARRGGSALLLSGKDAHAWPEVYLDGYGWVVFDVSPETVLTPPPGPPDPDLQRLLGELLRGENALPPDAAPDLPRLAAQALDWGRLLGLGFAALVLAFVVFLVCGKLWRRVAPALVRDETLPRVAYRAELDRLSELSLRRAAGESREAFARRVRHVVPSFEALTRDHVGAAFGSARASRDRDRYRDLARAVRREASRAFPRWRRLVGAVNPFSWLRSR